MANLKSTVISGNGQFTASRLIGNADTATSLQVINLTSENIAEYCTVDNGSYFIYNLEPGNYVCANGNIFTGETEFSGNKALSIESLEIGTSKIVSAKTNMHRLLLGSTTEEIIPWEKVYSSKDSFTIVGWTNITFPAIEHVESYTVNNNAITPSDTQYAVPIGTTLNITVNLEENYKITNLSLNGTSVTTNTISGKATKYNNTFEVSVELDKLELTVTKPEGVNLTINDQVIDTSTATMLITPNSSVHVVAIPDEAYNITSITLNDTPISTDYTFTMTEPVNIVIASAIKMYNVKVFHPEHGTITVNGDTQNEYTFAHGSSLLIDVVPDEGWYVDRLDISKPTDIYHITTEGSDASTYTITVNGDPIDPNGYAAGTELNVVVTPATGYNVTAVTRSGYEFAANDSFIINYDNVINVTTSPIMYNVRVFQPEVGGHIEINGQTGTSFDFAYGSAITIESVADDGYEVVRLDVSKDTDTYGVTIDAPNASVVLSPDKAATSDNKYYAGTKIDYTVTPNTGYDITNVTVNENDEAGTSGSWIINYDSTITVTASVQMVNIAVEQPEHGQITVNGEVGTSFDFPKGSSGIVIQATADEGYRVEGLYVTNLDEQAATASTQSEEPVAIDNVIDTTAEAVDETPSLE